MSGALNFQQIAYSLYNDLTDRLNSAPADSITFNELQETRDSFLRNENFNEALRREASMVGAEESVLFEISQDIREAFNRSFHRDYTNHDAAASDIVQQVQEGNPDILVTSGIISPNALSEYSDAYEQILDQAATSLRELQTPDGSVDRSEFADKLTVINPKMAEVFGNVNDGDKMFRHWDEGLVETVDTALNENPVFLEQLIEIAGDEARMDELVTMTSTPEGRDALSTRIQEQSSLLPSAAELEEQEVLAQEQLETQAQEQEQAALDERLSVYRQGISPVAYGDPAAQAVRNSIQTEIEKDRIEAEQAKAQAQEDSVIDDSVPPVETSPVLSDSKIIATMDQLQTLNPDNIEFAAPVTQEAFKYMETVSDAQLAEERYNNSYKFGQYGPVSTVDENAVPNAQQAAYEYLEGLDGDQVIILQEDIARIETLDVEQGFEPITPEMQANAESLEGIGLAPDGLTQLPLEDSPPEIAPVEDAPIRTPFGAAMASTAPDETIETPSSSIPTVSDIKIADTSILLDGEGANDMDYLQDLIEEAKELGVDVSAIDALEAQINSDTNQFVTTQTASVATTQYAQDLEIALDDGILDQAEYNGVLSNYFTTLSEGIVEDTIGLNDIGATAEQEASAQAGLQKVADLADQHGLSMNYNDASGAVPANSVRPSMRPDVAPASGSPAYLADTKIAAAAPSI